MKATHDVIYINISYFDIMSSINMGFTSEVSENIGFTGKFNP